MAVDANGMPVRFIVTEGTTADCTKACELIKGIPAECLFGDKAYDFNELIDLAMAQGMNIVIPSKINRLEPRKLDRYLYKLRHIIENTFMHLKRWRGIAFRFSKNTTSFVASLQIRCIMMWLSIS
jgi:transposase